MIELSINKQEYKRGFKDACIYFVYNFLIIAIVVFVPMIVCLVLGILYKDWETTSAGISFGIIWILSVLIIMTRYIHLKKSFLYAWKNDCDGILTYMIEKRESTFIITNVNKNKSIEIPFQIIKGIWKSKNAFIIVYTCLIDGKYGWSVFPRNVELEQMFNDYPVLRNSKKSL